MPTKSKTEKRVAPMVPAICPICKGSGIVFNNTLKCNLKCRGCKGLGWVEVHLGEVVPAPPIKAVPNQPNPYIQNEIPDDILKQLGGNNYPGHTHPKWTYGTTDPELSSNNVTYKDNLDEVSFSNLKEEGSTT